MKMIFLRFFLLLLPLQLFAADNSILIYGGGTVQVTSEINTYENVAANKQIQGSVLITHDSNNVVDYNSFRLGDQPLEVVFVKTIPMSSYSQLVLSIYQFKIEGKPPGQYTLPQISVKVGGKVYQAPPLTIQVP